MPYFATQVALLAHRPCSVATESARLEPGRILIAPGDAHIRLVKTVEGAAIRLSREPDAERLQAVGRSDARIARPRCSGRARSRSC